MTIDYALAILKHHLEETACVHFVPKYVWFIIMKDVCIPQNVIEKLEAKNLFYPSAGYDLEDLVKWFSPSITNFYFIDIIYDSKTALTNETEYKLLDQANCSLNGKTINNKEQYKIEISKQLYEDINLRHQFSVYMCRGRGYDAFRSIFKLQDCRMSIFFYRGDSGGEGGSGFNWLKKPRLRNILEVLEDGGLIITDGSNSDRMFNKHDTKSDSNIDGPTAFNDAQSFLYAERKFNCVGYLDNKNGPTLIWQVTKIPRSG